MNTIEMTLMKSCLQFKGNQTLKNQSTCRSQVTLIFLYSMVLISLLLSILGSASAKEVHQGLELIERRYQHHRYVEARLSLEQLTLSQHWLDAENKVRYGSINNFNSKIRQRDQSLIFAINSGIYTKEYTPLGLYIENRKVLNPLNLVKFNKGQGNFALLPNGVFYLTTDNRAYIADTDTFHLRYQGDYQTIQDAVQSGPMLLIDGEYNPHFLPKSDSLRIRSGVCTIENGKKVIFVVTEDRVNFYEFASYFKEQLQCQNALYLDGTLARMYINDQLYGASFWQAKPLVGIWSVIEKNP
ncbi:phosphodiester glycosidase family protein [Ignatzschineria rhizosphaerae]|uniref:Phosphodiester glycosidase family protein n=1 Tax=Ignatzschineria rhizosphaerae TaxID=2923279 RepID=A0ABY3X0C5_9GAMM|nr:phosphodiester glycosidase family protein [Ignatzschineria rhizosphaerae]UNM96314.1 phosphodiester glycosidase family protein [Ignatzschineria rhizosphaerae]